MRLDPRRPALCVVQATIANGDGTATLVARAMPAAPFGTPAWQLPIVAGYLGRLRRTGDAPTAKSFAAYLDARAGATIPSPHQPYVHAPWHDDRVTCLIDLALTPRGEMGWPATSLVVLEQEAGRGRCSWNRLERHRGYLAVLAHTARETAAEHARLTDRLRTDGTDGLRELHALAADVTSWAAKMHRAAKGDHTLARAAAVREAVR